MTWKPGQSGNPAGGPGPQNKPYRDALRMEAAALGNREIVQHPKGSLRSIAQARLLAAAKEAGTADAKEIADRLDGRVPQAIVGERDHPPITMIVTGVPRAIDDDDN
jgi:hypothetical protein